MSDEVRITDPNTGGQKGQKGARFDLIPPEELWELAEHCGKGEAKYPSPKPGMCNWQLGYRYSLSIGAMLRHFYQWLRGEEIDPETGSHHLIAVAWHALTLRWFTKHKPEHDDRTVTVLKGGKDK